jgi:hypothetical protein
MSEQKPTRVLSDYELLRRYEPILRFTQGEIFFPTDIDRYVQQCSLWISHADGTEEQLLAEGDLTLDQLAQPREMEGGAVLYLRFVDPPSLSKVARRALKEGGLSGRARGRGWAPGQARLARVGYLSRVVDALFTLTLMARGKVPGAVAAIAEEESRSIDAQGEKYVYYGRVFRDSGWIGLQYWYFYRYDDWRTAFEGVNDHEADWETIFVFLYEDTDGTLKPHWAVFSCHDFTGDDLRRRWDDRAQLELVGDHPVAYVGAGSHAAYFCPGEYLIESEIPPLRRVAPVWNWVRNFWGTTIQRGARVTRAGQNLFAIPFVEYARGDGLSIGPGQEKEWEGVLLDPPPSWLTDFRGLWGLYARDPIGGENAPAGPMYNRDGTPRESWYDPLGYAGLDKVPTPPDEIKRLEREQGEITQRQQELERQIAARMDELHDLGAKRSAMDGFPSLRDDSQQLDEHIQRLSAEVRDLRHERSQNEALLSALAHRLEKRRSGQEDPPHAHIKVMQQPTAPEEIRYARLTELWSAVSIGLLMVIFVLLSILVPQRLVIGLAALVAAFALIESIFRGRFSETVRAVTLVLALLSSLVLIYTFFWQIIIGALLIGGLYLIWDNIRETLAGGGIRKPRSQPPSTRPPA